LIIFDTNVLPRYGSLSGPTLTLIRAIAGQTGHEVALPAIVIEESVAGLARNLQHAWDGVLTARAHLAQFLPAYRVDQPDLDKPISTWRTELERSFVVLEAPPGAAAEALRREAHRIPPTRTANRRGVGARDALIWLTVLDAHVGDSSDATYFVTGNPNDFGQGKLLPELQREVDDLRAPAAFRYLTSIKGVLEALANPVGDGPTESELLASDGLRAVVEQTLLSTAVEDREASLFGFAAISSASLRQADGSRAYEVNGRRYAAVNTVWDAVSTSFSVTTGGPSIEQSHHYLVRILLLVEVGASGHVLTADVAGHGPFVFERSEIRESRPRDSNSSLDDPACP
jgi:hypothetical protein